MKLGIVCNDHDVTFFILGKYKYKRTQVEVKNNI